MKGTFRNCRREARCGLNVFVKTLTPRMIEVKGIGHNTAFSSPPPAEIMPEKKLQIFAKVFPWAQEYRSSQ